MKKGLGWVYGSFQVQIPMGTKKGKKKKKRRNKFTCKKNNIDIYIYII